MTQSVVGALRVVLGLDTAQFEKGLTAAQKQLRGVARSMQETGNSMMAGGAALTIGITAPFIALMATSRQAAIESRTAVGQVESALASMGAAAGRTQKQLEDQAKALQALSVFDDDDILRKVTANLLTFGNVSGGVFDRAQLAAVNLSARLQGDLQGATMMLGKALNDPVKGMTALTRAGVSLEKSTQDRIKSLVKSGQLEQAQIILLREVERQFNGAAAAQRAADPDAATRDVWREMQETLGDIALRVLPPLTAALTSAMDAFNNLSPEMQATVVGGFAIAAALGPVVTVLGGMVTASGAVVGVLAKFGPQLTGTAAGTTALGRAMVGLRTAMMFLVTTPWGLLLTGIALAVGLLVVKMREATPVQKALKKSADDLTEAQRRYEDAVNKATVAQGKGKAAALELVRAERARLEIAIRNTQAALANAQAEMLLFRARRQEAQKMTFGAGGGASAGMTVAAFSDQEVRARRQIEAEEERLEAARRSLADFTAGLNRPLNLGGTGADGGGGRRSRGPSADQLRQEAEQRLRTREDMEHEVRLEEARLTNNLDLVRSLEREESVRQRTRALIDAGILKDAAAAEEAERVQKRLDEAMEAQLAREHTADRRQHDMALNRLEGREDLNERIERQIQYEERVAFWQSQQLDLLSAQEAAKLDMAQIDAARAVAAEREARAMERQHEIELARLRGDEREERRLRRLAEVEARAREYQTREFNPLDPDAARRQAERDVTELDDAEMQGRFRDFIKDGWRAAMDGDLSDFARKWVTEWAGRGLEDALNGLADLLAQIFRSTDWGSVFGKGGGGGGGFDWGSIGSTVGGWFKKLPGFANGGSILPGGSGGIDSQLVQFRKSPGERVDIYTPGQDMGAGAARPLHFDLRGAVLTADLLEQINRRVATGEARAIRTSTAVAKRAAPGLQQGLRRLGTV